MEVAEQPFIIAIDGPAASGKSTLGEKLAKALDFFYFDTGVMYRAATLAALCKLGEVGDEEAVTRITKESQIDVQIPSYTDGRGADVLLNGKDVTWAIRTSDVEQHVSEVSAYAGVRKALTERQRQIGLRGNMVMAGRDIGTVVFPDARYKIYLDASPEERAQRRYLEIKQRGGFEKYEDILGSIIRRDRIDSTREHAPLKAATDAFIIHTDGKTIDQVLEECLAFLNLPYKKRL